MQNKKGFTLIELLVVVLIIAILSAVALPQYIKTVERTRSTEALLNLKAFTDAANRYWMANDQSYVGILASSGPVTSTNIPNVDITLPTTGWFLYNVGGVNLSNNGYIADATAETLVLGARRDTATARRYAYNYFLLNGELVARTCSSMDSTLCKGLVTITSTSPAACGASANGSWSGSGATLAFNGSSACVLRN